MRVPIWRVEVEGVGSSEAWSAPFVAKPTAELIGKTIWEDTIEAKASEDCMDQEDRELLVVRLQNCYPNVAVAEEVGALETGRSCATDAPARLSRSHARTRDRRSLRSAGLGWPSPAQLPISANADCVGV